MREVARLIIKAQARAEFERRLHQHLHLACDLGASFSGQVAPVEPRLGNDQFVATHRVILLGRKKAKLRSPLCQSVSPRTSRWKPTLTRSRPRFRRSLHRPSRVRFHRCNKAASCKSCCQAVERASYARESSGREEDQCWPYSQRHWRRYSGGGWFSVGELSTTS